MFAVAAGAAVSVAKSEKAKEAVVWKDWTVEGGGRVVVGVRREL